MKSILTRLKKGNNFRSNKHIGSHASESSEFKKRLAFLRRSEFWSKRKLEAFQLKELKRVVSFAYDRIPYYRERFDAAHITPRDIQTLADIKKLPTLTRADIKANYEKLLPKGTDPKKLLFRTTGGSTGDPLVIFSDMHFVSRDRANTLYYLGVAGVNPYHYKSVRLYGDRVPEKLVRRGVYWYNSHKGNQLVMSCYHITASTVRSYVDAINAFRPEYIHSRPSALYTLARHMHEAKLTLLKPLRTLFCDGEILYDYQRALIEKVFGARLYLTYGHTEGAVVGISCPRSHLLHFLPQVGILEILDRKDRSISKEGGRGEMVVTGFNNDLMPLIRYRTQDMAIGTKKTCPCDRHYQMVKKVEGRLQDYIIDTHGSVVPLAPAIFNYNDMDWTGVSEFKIEQREKGKLRIQVQLHLDAHKAAVKRRLTARLPKIFGPGFSLQIIFVDTISYSPIGKHRYLEQKLPTPLYG